MARPLKFLAALLRDLASKFLFHHHQFSFLFKNTQAPFAFGKIHAKKWEVLLNGKFAGGRIMRKKKIEWDCFRQFALKTSQNEERKLQSVFHKFFGAL